MIRGSIGWGRTVGALLAGAILALSVVGVVAIGQDETIYA